MKMQDVYREIVQTLERADIPDAGFEAGVLVQHVTGRMRFEVDEVGEQRLGQLRALAAKRALRQPLQYLIGHWAFLDLELEVGPGVLIPRPETEEVCLAAAACLAGRVAPVVLDVCAGTGAIALGVQSMIPAAEVAALEWDAEAFAYLERNIAVFVAAHSRAPTALRADALTYYKMLGAASLDLIVSNPPYVSEAEYGALAPELYYEPRQALVAEQNGLLFYEVIVEKYAFALKNGGALVFEIGGEQGDAVAGFMRRAGFTEVEIRKDMAGFDRIVLGRWPGA